MDDERGMADSDRRALLAELVCGIDVRNEAEGEVVLFVLLTSAWPTPRAQLS
jgi:hypothetical protein